MPSDIQTEIPLNLTGGTNYPGIYEYLDGLISVGIIPPRQIEVPRLPGEIGEWREPTPAMVACG